MILSTPSVRTYVHKSLILLSSALLAACMTSNGPYVVISPNPSTTPDSLEHWDKDTRFKVSNRNESGFTLTVSFVQYQFVPDQSDVAYNCHEATKKIALKLAKDEGIAIAPISEKNIESTFGRNGFTGNTTCIATAQVVRKV
jgi:hypothetical protein